MATSKKAASKKATIYDIATSSKTSPTTVSMVLSGQWKKHRIKPETAQQVMKWAGELGYSVNQKARGLRLSRSGVAGMVLPHYRNRYFAGLAEAFEAEARERDLCPIVVSTKRDPAIEAKVTETLLAQQVEFLFITGVHDPSPLNDMCAAAGIRCVNIDLPGPKAPSVVSDNHAGAEALTELVVGKLISAGMSVADWFFFGGVRDDNSTRRRMEGFKAALERHGVHPSDDAFSCEGYAPDIARRALEGRYEKLGRLPAGLFVNGVPAMEGAATFLATLPREVWGTTKIGAFDWDPFAAQLPFDLSMVRQDVDAIVDASFALIDEYPGDVPPQIVVPVAVR